MVDLANNRILKVCHQTSSVGLCIQPREGNLNLCILYCVLSILYPDMQPWYLQYSKVKFNSFIQEGQRCGNEKDPMEAKLMIQAITNMLVEEMEVKQIRKAVEEMEKQLEAEKALEADMKNQYIQRQEKKQSVQTLALGAVSAARSLSGIIKDVKRLEHTIYFSITL